jgi:hypothetical protein
MIFLNVYIFDPRGHTPAINQSLVNAAGTGEQQADTRKKCRVAAPTLLCQGNILV